MQFKGFTLDKFQEEAVNEIEKNNSVVVSAPTGSGKTLIADYIIDKDLRKGVKVIYTAPIKALSNQKYKEFSKDYGKKNIGLLTGDIVINPNAPILIMTTEIYRNMALTEDKFLEDISYVIFDEIHYINDIERGYVWEESIIFSRENVRFLCLSATIPNASEFADWIGTIKKHNVSVVKSTKRNVPLHRHFYDSELGICSLQEINKVNDIPDYNYIHGKRRRRRPRIKPPSHVELVKEIKDMLPCFFFVFSRINCERNAEQLLKASLFSYNKEITNIIRKKLSKVTPEINKLCSTRVLRKTLPYGIGFHHAGLLPVIKELVEELFGGGYIKVLYTTETFAVGINMPAKTVCFQSLRKFDGINFRYLNSKEYFQIAGRAGRRGIDKEGFSFAMIDRRDFDFLLLHKITDKDIEPIKSHFRLSVNTVLNIIKRHSPEKIKKILQMNFYTFQTRSKANEMIATFGNIKKKLQKLKFLNEDKLTWKGEFGTKIYSDEILTSEVFATDFYKDLNEYHLLLLLGVIVYEDKERTEFYKKINNDFLKELRKKIRMDDYLSKEKKFLKLKKIAALIDPAYNGKSIFDIMKNTNLLEGDLIRFFRQILDRIGQILDATSDEKLVFLLKNCRKVVDDSLKDIDSI